MVTRSRWPRALTGSTQKPLSALWNVTRSTIPASTSWSGWMEGGGTIMGRTILSPPYKRQKPRRCKGGVVHHVMMSGNGRSVLFPYDCGCRSHRQRRLASPCYLTDDNCCSSPIGLWSGDLFGKARPVFGRPDTPARCRHGGADCVTCSPLSGRTASCPHRRIHAISVKSLAGSLRHRPGTPFRPPFVTKESGRC